MLPTAAVRALVDEELPPLIEWAESHGSEVEWNPDSLLIRVVLPQPVTGDEYYLLGDLHGYRAVPPAWEFADSAWETDGGKRNYPAPAVLPFGGSSIFHAQPVICAPFNRLAWKQNGGPHQNWGTPDQWLSLKENTVRAETLGDMVSVVARDLAYSPGRMT